MDGSIPQLTVGLYDQLASSVSSQEPVLSTPRIVQVLQPKAVNAVADGRKLWRLLISDGTHILQAMAPSQVSPLFENGHVGNGSIVRIKRLVVKEVRGIRIVFVPDFEVLAKGAAKIGNPTLRNLGSLKNTSEPPGVAEPSRPQTAPESSRATVPIMGLNPYSSNWTIKALLSQKSEIKTWSNQRSDGSLFQFTLRDDSGEIRGVGFTVAVDRFYDKLVEGKVYYISKARVNHANKRFNNTSHDYELTLEKNTEIDEHVNQGGRPDVKDGFVKLDDLTNRPLGSTCDIVAVVREVGEIVTYLTRDNKMDVKRELTLVDCSNSSTKLTLWGRHAKTYKDNGSKPVVAFKGLKVDQFQRRTLSTTNGSTIMIDPDTHSAHALRRWYDTVGVHRTFEILSNGGLGSEGAPAFNRAEVQTIEEIQAGDVTEKAVMFSCRGTIWRIKNENLVYPACPNQSCKKKAIHAGGGGWHCEKCEKTWEKPEYRYILSMAVSDHTGQAQLQGFHNVGLAILGRSADDLMKIKDGNAVGYESTLRKPNFSTFNFACRAKLDTYQGQSKVRYGISKILPLNYREEAGYLRDILKSNWAK